MDKNRRKVLQEQYKEIKTYMGIIQIMNQINGKRYIATCSNLKNRWMTIKWQLDIGRFMNLELQKEWNEYGFEAFTYEVLEEKEVKDDTDTKWELRQMEKVWMEKLQPYGEKGYNHPLKATK
jgi:hypothetical protein